MCSLLSTSAFQNEFCRVLRTYPVAQVAPYTVHSSSPLTAQQLLRYVDPLTPDINPEKIRARFAAEPNLRAIPVVKNGKPVGIIKREHCREDNVRPDLCEPLRVDKNMPLEELGDFLSAADGQPLDDGFIITDQGCYCGVASVRDLLRELMQMRREAAHLQLRMRLPDGQFNAHHPACAAQ